MYIKINGSDERYEANLMPFKTQHGNQGVEVLNGMPQTDKGFKVYNDNDKVFADYSDYIYLYRENQYTTVEETIIPAQCGYSPLPPSQISRQIASLNNRVSEVTPYTETKQAYIDDTECVFNTSVKGNVSAFVVDKEGNNISNTVTIENDKIKVSFEALKNVATVTISVQ